MRPLAVSLAVLLASAPLVARAECRSIPECLQQAGLGPPRVGPEAALVMGALAAPAILVGGIVTVGGELRKERPAPAGVVPGSTDPNAPIAMRRPNLLLVPPPEPAVDPEPPTDPSPTKNRKRPEPSSGALQFNNVAGAVVGGLTAAAILTGFIAGMVKK